MKKFGIAFFTLICFILLTVAAPLAAAANLYEQEAQVLVSLGLLRGSGQGLELNKPLSRGEGAVMLVRLLGKENYALSKNYPHPFVDVPAWVSPYIGYLYRENLCYGTGSNTYSPQKELHAREYVVFLLRALGYQDGLDFEYKQALLKAWQINMLDEQAWHDLQNAPVFRRADMVWLSYLALGRCPQNENCTLLEKLTGQSAFPVPAFKIIPEKSFPAYAPYAPAAYTVGNSDELASCLEMALMNLQPGVTLYLEKYRGDIPADFPRAMEKALENINTKTGFHRLIKGWSYKGNHSELNVQFRHIYSPHQIEQLQQKVKQITAALQPSLSEYEQELLLHDYIVKHTRYDYENMLNNSIPELSYTPYGVLVLGTGVCQGYAEAMHLLCTQSGIHSLVISGTSRASDRWTKHAWNIVRINGSCYHVDVAWDDVRISRGEKLFHTYFNLNDNDIQKDHSWNRSDYPSCTANECNYYLYNNLLVEDYGAFKERVSLLLSRRNKEISLKVKAFNAGDYNHLSSFIFSEAAVSGYDCNIDQLQGVITIFNLQYAY